MPLKIQTTTGTGGARPDALALFVPAATKIEPADFREVDRRIGGGLSAAIQRPDFSAEPGVCTSVYPEPGGEGPAQRVILVGLGDPAKLTRRRVCQAAAALCRVLAAGGVSRVQVGIDGLVAAGFDAATAGRLIGQGLSSASFTFDDFRGAAAGDRMAGPPRGLRVAAPAAARRAMGEALLVGAAANTARRLAATPPNVADPAYIQKQCRTLARRTGLACRVITAKQAGGLGMGGLLAVGRGGSSPPRMIVLEHRPAGAAGDPILLVGKTITFDTGGYSLKVGGSMKGMKYDKAGGCAVIGIMEAVAGLNLKQPVVALIACAENMVDTDAYRVDDILTLANGVTVEVTNTDAEGRLVLADALAWGTVHYRPRAVIDLATLTGGVVVALGNQVAGGWCNDQALWQRVLRASEASCEQVWRMPLDEAYRDMMKGQHADLHNSAPVRAAHPVQGAAFLSYFVGEDGPRRMPTIPWCHLDIAGTATTDEASALFEKGPTGYGVRLVTELIARWSDRKD